MRVLVLTNMFPTEDRPHFGIFVDEQVESLRRLGIDVDVLFMDGRASKLNYFKGMWALRRRIREQHYDLDPRPLHLLRARRTHPAARSRRPHASRPRGLPELGEVPLPHLHPLLRPRDRRLPGDAEPAGLGRCGHSLRDRHGEVPAAAEGGGAPGARAAAG